MLIAIFGIDGGALSLVVNLLVLFLFAVWVALIYWTYQDAKRRIEDPVLIACATAASFFPYIGTVVYTILRPPEFLEDRDERALELRAAELRLRQLIEQSCPHCEYPIETDYLRCPNCERRLRSPCRKCHKPLDPKWGTCPYCETEVRRRRESARSDAAGRSAERAARSDRSSRSSRTMSSDSSRERTGSRSPSRSAGLPRSEGSSRSEPPRREPAPAPSTRPSESRSGRRSRPTS